MSLLALVTAECSLRVQFEDFPAGNVSGLSQLHGELLLGSVPVLAVAQCPALGAGSKIEMHLSPSSPGQALFRTAGWCQGILGALSVFM